jgi:hypothetical protein
MSKNKFIFGFMMGIALGAFGGAMLQKNQRSIKAKLRYLKMRADIERQLRGLKKFTREAHDKIVEQALKEYGDKAEIAAAKLGLIEMELKGRWKEAKSRFEAAAHGDVEERKEDDEDDDE